MPVIITAALAEFVEASVSERLTTLRNRLFELELDKVIAPVEGGGYRVV